MNDVELLKVLAERHLAIHEGRAFFFQEENATLGTGGKLEVQFITPAGAGKGAHLHPITLSTDGTESVLEIIEAPTITDGDSAVPLLNMNRGSSNTSGIVAWNNPTAISLGTTVYTRTIGPGTFQVLLNELILAKDTDYVFRLTNNDAGTVNTYMTVPWTE